jgi:N-methylhydantoinase A
MRNVRANPKTKSRPIRVGVDTGGTFTDFVFELSNRIQVFKLPSTPADPSDAIVAGLNRIADLTGTKLQNIEVVHGTTVGTNALLQRRGARAALITTKGFEDVLAIGRQARPELYNLNAVRPPTLVPESLRFGVSERVASSGEVLTALEDDQLEQLVTQLEAANVEAIAVALLFSFVHPEHEKRIARAVSSLNVPVSVSHQILPEYREYERTSTVTINAYLQPLMGSYLRKLAAHVPKLRVMQSSGGSISAAAAADEPVRTILSGPAGGVVGALRSARSAGLENIITFDMGGTSTDVALCDRNGFRMTNEALVAGLPVAVSVLDIHTVGAGGGSIARVDEGGSLRVGPESAGADPGPAAYGRSMLPTVTDAHVVLGHFGGTGLLGGEFPLDEKRSREAISNLATEMTKVAGRKVSTIAAAQGVVSVANTNMERALRTISVERGYDPRDFVLLPFGGAGGLHAVDLARALRVPRVIAPTAAGALSAIGVVTADVVKDLSRTVMLEVGPGIEKALANAFRELELAASAALHKEGFPESKQRSKRSLAARYKGQSFELIIDLAKGGAENIAKTFHRAHRVRYGYAQESDVIEIVSTKLRAIGEVEKFSKPRLSNAKRKASARAHSSRVAYFDGVKCSAGIHRREDLIAGMKLKAPCIVTEYSATTLIPPGAQASIDRYGNLIVVTS